MDWAGLNEAALAAERDQGQHGRRVVRLFHDAGPELWLGLYGNAPVEADGRTGWQYSDGDIVTL